MANIHILRIDGRSVTAVAHVAIPGVNNDANIPYRTAIVRSGFGGSTILPDGDGTAGTISAAEKTSIQSGALVEVPMRILLSALPGNTAQCNAFLDALFNAEQTRVRAEAQVSLRYYGATR